MAQNSHHACHSHEREMAEFDEALMNIKARSSQTSISRLQKLNQQNAKNMDSRNFDHHHQTNNEQIMDIFSELMSEANARVNRGELSSAYTDGKERDFNQPFVQGQGGGNQYEQKPFIELQDSTSTGLPKVQTSLQRRDEKEKGIMNKKKIRNNTVVQTSSYQENQMATFQAPALSDPCETVVTSEGDKDSTKIRPKQYQRRGLQVLAGMDD